tara:strand:- start:299 stop:547 length:249 start_codon:yes stop_codon:yes gene_type:complete
MKRIIYIDPASETITILTPTPQILNEVNASTGELWTVEDIAKKDVPTGSKYKIVENEDVPTDRSFRDAWTVNESDLTDGEGA